MCLVDLTPVMELENEGAVKRKKKRNLLAG